MMGATRSDLSEEDQAISDALAESFASYINEAGFVDENGNTLALTASESGICQAGSYYDYLLGVIEDSLNTFLAETSFPYDASTSSGEMGRPGGHSGGRPSGMPDGEARKTGGPDDGSGSAASSGGRIIEDVDDIQRTGSGSGVQLSGTYDFAQAYIDALNANGVWVTYNAATNAASITSIEDFTQAMKNASKSLGAFDQLDGSQGENELFGTDGSSAHFDAALAQILEDIGAAEAADYAEDLAATDALGISTAQRLAMYTPLYYLLGSEDGYGTSDIAKYWRIRTGISQGDTSLTTEVNLALALQNNESVESVDFATVWGQQHTEAETSGSSTGNFVTWVEECTE